MLILLPVAAAGLAFQDQLATGARQVGLIAATSILFGLLLGWADRVVEVPTTADSVAARVPV